MIFNISSKEVVCKQPKNSAFVIFPGLKYHVGEKVHYRCYKGSPVHSIPVTCSKTGEWVPRPKCKGMLLPKFQFCAHIFKIFSYL